MKYQIGDLLVNKERILLITKITTSRITFYDNLRETEDLIGLEDLDTWKSFTHYSVDH